MQASDDRDEVPLYLGVGACHELAAAGRKPGRPRRKEPIGFVHFGAPKRRSRRQSAASGALMCW